MLLINIVIVVLLQRFLHFRRWFSDAWFRRYYSAWAPVLQKVNNWLGVVIIVVPVLLLLLLINLLLTGYLLGLVKLIFVAIVFLGCISVFDFKRDLKAYFAAMESDNLALAKQAVYDFFQVEPEHDKTKLIRQVTRAIFTKSYEEMFGVIFWFIILGSYGAVFYLLITLLDKIASNKEVALIKGVLDWFVLRLLSVCFALTGNFAKEFAYCRDSFNKGTVYNCDFLRNIGLAAINADESETKSLTVNENYEAIHLVDRTLLIWMVLVALFVLGIIFP